MIIAPVGFASPIYGAIRFFRRTLEAEEDHNIITTGKNTMRTFAGLKPCVLDSIQYGWYSASKHAGFSLNRRWEKGFRQQLIRFAKLLGNMPDVTWA
jgi:hypothetical protein